MLKVSTVVLLLINVFYLFNIYRHLSNMCLHPLYPEIF